MNLVTLFNSRRSGVDSGMLVIKYSLQPNYLLTLRSTYQKLKLSLKVCRYAY